MGENEDFKPKTSWLDPLNRNLIRAAVRARNETVVLRDGRRMKLEFSKDRGYETVRLTPEHGFIPQGEFDVKRIVDPINDWTTTEVMW